MSDLAGKVFIFKNRPCRVDRVVASMVWVDFLDNREAKIGRFHQRIFVDARLIRGGQGYYFTRLAALHLDERLPFADAQRRALDDAD